MVWVVDGPGRRVSNDALGVCLVEGKGRDGDIEFRLLDASGNWITDFFARSDFRDEAHNNAAPPGANYAVVASVFSIGGLKGKSEVAVNGGPVSTDDVLAMIVEALSRAVAMYDLGFPKYVRIDFLDDWPPVRSRTVFLPSP